MEALQLFVTHSRRLALRRRRQHGGRLRGHARLRRAAAHRGRASARAGAGAPRGRRRLGRRGARARGAVAPRAAEPRAAVLRGGKHRRRRRPASGDYLVTAGSVALSVAGFGFFVSVVLKGPGGALRWTLLLLSVALWCKFAMASVMLKPHLSAGWVTEGRVLGLAAGLLAFVPLRGLAPDRAHLPRHRPHARRRALRQDLRRLQRARRLPAALQLALRAARHLRHAHALSARVVAGAGARVAVRPLRVAARRADTMTAPTDGIAHELLQAPRLLLPEPARGARGLLREPRRRRPCATTARGA